MKTDVLVVGAGPVGLTMAAELKRYGLSVRIVEKAAQATDKSKALVLWSRTLELMDRMGCTASFVEAGFKAAGVTITAGNKEIAHFTLDGLASPYPFALMIPQADTERLLAHHLNSLGVMVERRLELVTFATSPAGVQATLRHADGREELMESSWLVGCDGAHSTVRHQLGMEFPGNTLTSDWMLADVHLSGVENPGETKVMWHAEGVLIIFPINQTRYRVIADAGEAVGDGRRPDPTLEEIQAILDRRGPGGIKATAPLWLAAFRINERKVSEYRKGRIFVCGDAAHVHSPAGGQGMNTGMQDAMNLAWKLALVGRAGGAESLLLDSYSSERSTVGDLVLKGAGRLTTMATLKGGVKQSIRNHIASLVFGLAPVRETMVKALSELSIGYPDSALSVQGSGFHRGPQAGQRAPIREHEPAVGAGNTPRFALFAEPDAGAAQLFGHYPSFLEAGVRAPFEKGGRWLVRPDGYVAVATAQGDWDTVFKYLEKLTADAG